MNIGWDIDGVLLDSVKFQLEVGSKYLDLPVINPDGYDIKDMFNVSQETDNKFWHDNIKYYATKVDYRENARRISQKIYEDGDKLFIITNRCMDLDYCLDILSIEEMQELTKQSLKSHGIYFDEIIFTDNKLEVCYEYNIELMVEDSDTNLSKLSTKSDMLLLAYKAGYNEKNYSVTTNHVTNFLEIYDFIQFKKLQRTLKDNQSRYINADKVYNLENIALWILLNSSEIGNIYCMKKLITKLNHTDESQRVSLREAFDLTNNPSILMKRLKSLVEDSALRYSELFIISFREDTLGYLFKENDVGFLYSLSDSEIMHEELFLDKLKMELDLYKIITEPVKVNDKILSTSNMKW